LLDSQEAPPLYGSQIVRPGEVEEIMKIYRRVIPKISKDIIRTLLANKAIEIEDGHRDEAELDIAGVLVRYMNEVDSITADAHDTMTRHNFTPDMLGRVKRTIAGQRKIEMGPGSEEFVINQIIEGLFDSRHIEEIFCEDNEIRTFINTAITKYFGVDEELDREVRGRLRNLREGTAEWEVEYGRLIEQMRGAKYVQ
jgi:hypothetical protein